MNINRFSLPILVLSAFILFPTSCSKEEDPILLMADAGLNQTVKPRETVTLDGSESAGPEGFTYHWAYSGEVAEDDINLQGITTAYPTFTPPIGSVYTFTLTLNSGSHTSEDQVTVVASGGIEIGGVLEEDLSLIDIEPDAGIPDYIVSSDLIVPEGITLSVAEQNVVVFFEESAGLHVTSGGSLSNVPSEGEEGYNVWFTGDETEGWKGIWIQNGHIELDNSTIENAGRTNFSEREEPASLILSGAQTDLISISSNEFRNSHSYDVLVPEKIGGNGYFKHNDFSYKNPVKAHVSFLNFYITNYPNLDPETFDYHIIIPSGTESKDVIDGTFSFHESKFLLDGDFWAGSRISITRSTIYMKEGTAIITEKEFTSRGSENDPSLIVGYEGAPWKGIAVLERDPSVIIEFSTIKNAGFGIIEAGDFTAETNATLYSQRGTGKIQDSKFLDGGGYGYYNADTTTTLWVQFYVQDSEFINLPKAALRTNVANVSSLFLHVYPVNHFELPPGVPAVLVEGDGSPTKPWPGLGGDNFYLIDAKIIPGATDGFNLQAGVHLKFRAGRSFVYNPQGTASALNWRGSADQPIILEGELNTPGSWGGVYLGGKFGWWEIDHCIIKNGGEFILSGASEKANVISAFSGQLTNSIRFNNSTVSDSEGYGIVVEAGTHDVGYDDPAKNNTFSGNASGDVIVK